MNSDNCTQCVIALCVMFECVCSFACFARGRLLCDSLVSPSRPHCATHVSLLDWLACTRLTIGHPLHATGALRRPGRDVNRPQIVMPRSVDVSVVVLVFLLMHQCCAQNTPSSPTTSPPGITQGPLSTVIPVRQAAQQCYTTAANANRPGDRIDNP
jgi:hypothetical protein